MFKKRPKLQEGYDGYPLTNEHTVDPYNGDDGPGFDYEFHAQLLAGAHLLNDNDRAAFMLGWNACRDYMDQSQKSGATDNQQRPKNLGDTP